jgi:ketosteroid isomerase-like protein
MKTAKLILAFMTLFSGSVHAGNEEQQLVATVSGIFAALSTEDTAKFDSLTCQDFYAFDGGARFTRDAMMGMIKAQHSAGKRYEWNVTDPDVHVDGNTGWIAYINKGSITDSSGTVKQNWLESAFLERRADNWKVVFVHSTRVPMKREESHGN